MKTKFRILLSLFYLLIQVSINCQDGYIIVIGSNESDLSVVTILEEAEYQVERGLAHTGILSEAKLDSVNNADLVIFSRNGATAGHGEAEDVSQQWADVTAPILSLSPWIMRNNRWKWINSAQLSCHNSDSIAIPSDVKDHPIYTGVDVSSGLLEVIENGKTRNESFTIEFEDPDAGMIVNLDLGDDGILLATDPDESGIIAAEWEADSEFYEDGPICASHRMWLGFAVEGDNCKSEVTDNIMSAFNGNDACKTIFLNAVAHMEGVDLAPPDNITIKSTKNLIVYPNPANELLTINGLKDIISYEIFDITGALILKGSTNRNIDISGLQQGIYLLKASNNTWARFVKK